MTEYDFTLKFNLQNAQIDPDSYIEQLYEGGCEDALIGIGRTGYLSLNFTRAASSAYEAISSAIADVKRVIPQVTLIETTPDFVGLTDVANLLGCTRQNIRKLIINDDPSAPLPVYEGTPSLWHLADLLTWLQEAKAYAIDESLLAIAKTNMDINIANQWQKVEPHFQQEIKDLVA